MITIAATMGFNRTLLDAVDACVRCIRGMIPDVFDYSHERVGIQKQAGGCPSRSRLAFGRLSPPYMEGSEAGEDVSPGGPCRRILHRAFPRPEKRCA